MAFSTNGAGTIKYPYTKTKQIDKNPTKTLNHAFPPKYKTKSKWRILNINPKIMKHLKENMGENLCYLGLGKDFLENTKCEL